MGYQSAQVRGVGGWLAFFLVTLGVFTPLRAMLLLFQISTNPQIAESFGERWPAVRIVYWSLNGTIIAIAWFIAWRLIAVQRWTSVRMAVAGLWAIAILPNIVELVAISLITGVSIGTLLASGGFSLFQPLIYSAVWTAYLLQSARVWNTYALDDEDDGGGLADVFE
jgi:hypothetical protein